MLRESAISSLESHRQAVLEAIGTMQGDIGDTIFTKSDNPNLNFVGRLVRDQVGLGVGVFEREGFLLPDVNTIDIRVNSLIDGKLHLEELIYKPKDNSLSWVSMPKQDEDMVTHPDRNSDNHYKSEKKRLEDLDIPFVEGQSLGDVKSEDWIALGLKVLESLKINLKADYMRTK